jgi:hypothetical protein
MSQERTELGIEELAREYAALWKLTLTVKTKEEYEKLEERERSFSQRYQSLDLEAQNRVEEIASKLLKDDPEVPYFMKLIVSTCEDRISRIRRAAIEAEAKERLEIRKQLADELVRLITPALKEQIPSVVEEALAEQVPEQKLREAIKEAKKGKPVKAKKGCMHIEVGDVALVWR